MKFGHHKQLVSYSFLHSSLSQKAMNKKFAIPFMHEFFAAHQQKTDKNDYQKFEWENDSSKKMRWIMFSTFAAMCVAMNQDDDSIVHAFGYKRNTITNRVSIAQYSANNPIEDRFKCVQLKNLNGFIVSVFDGHGGTQASEYAMQHLDSAIDSAFQSILKSNYSTEDEWILECLKKGFEKVENDFLQLVRNQFYSPSNPTFIRAGSCCLVSLVYGNKVYTANLGDCRGIVVKRPGSTKSFHKLNKKQNANSRREQRELLNKFPHEKDIYVCKKNNPNACYVKGSLQPTGALGDFKLKYAEFNDKLLAKKLKLRTIENFSGPYIKSSPDITIHELSSDDSYLVLASDGLWDEISFSDVSKEISTLGNYPAKEKITMSLLEKALNCASKKNELNRQQLELIPLGVRRRLHDDITIVCVDLQNQLYQSLQNVGNNNGIRRENK